MKAAKNLLYFKICLAKMLNKRPVFLLRVKDQKKVCGFQIFFQKQFRNRPVFVPDVEGELF